MDVAMVVGWVVTMLVSSGCEISVGLVVAGSVWFQLQDWCWVLTVGMGGVGFAC